MVYFDECGQYFACGCYLNLDFEVCKLIVCHLIGLGHYNNVLLLNGGVE